MLTKLYSDGNAMPRIFKRIDGKDASAEGAFPADKTLHITVEVPRRLGASAVVLRLCRDGEADVDYPLTFTDTEAGVDRYTLSLPLSPLCGEEGRGLFFYEFLFLRGLDTLFTDTHNNVDFTLSTASATRFRLLVHRADFAVPTWFAESIMYHVFVDRFCRGEGKVGMREDAELNEDWETGIPQFPEIPGDRLSNHIHFGGNLWGVAQKLDYLQTLGVNVLYLSPVFRAYSNHKYDTGDYTVIDDLFGGEEAFDHLLAEAKARKMRVILDGVFNHTGDDSRYFDRYGKYNGTGAYSNPDSPYRDWFPFKNYPKDYESWWGIDILPKLNHSVESCREYFVGADGIGERYVKRGTTGWRLDVADELPNEFLDELCRRTKAIDPDVILIGEVWENAADKLSYGKRRRYFQGGQLDSVMNYPLRNGILEYLRYEDATVLGDTLVELYSSYPRSVCDSLMNLLGTHDTERILTVLGGIADETVCAEGYTNAELSVKRMTAEQRVSARKLLYLAAVLQFTVFGVPSVYYGDEAGMEGYHDPFCRMPYVWGREDQEILAFYKRLGQIRKTHAAFAGGDFRILVVQGGGIVYERKKGKDRVVIAVNRGKTPLRYRENGKWKDLLTDAPYGGVVDTDSAVILCKEDA